MSERTAARRAGGARPRPAAPAGRRSRGGAAPLDTAAFIRVARALAEATRFEILELIAERPEISCGEIVERFPLSQPAISHHLKLLADAGVVTVRRAGTHGHYRLAEGMLEGFVAELRRRLGTA